MKLWACCLLTEKSDLWICHEQSCTFSCEKAAGACPSPCSFSVHREKQMKMDWPVPNSPRGEISVWLGARVPTAFDLCPNHSSHSLLWLSLLPRLHFQTLKAQSSLGVSSQQELFKKSPARLSLSGSLLYKPSCWDVWGFNLDFNSASGVETSTWKMLETLLKHLHDFHLFFADIQNEAWQSALG